MIKMFEDWNVKRNRIRQFVYYVSESIMYPDVWIMELIIGKWEFIDIIGNVILGSKPF